MIKPKLSIFVGEAQISALKYASPKDYEFFSYSYAPMDSLTHNYSDKTRPHFLDQVVGKVFSEMTDANLADFDIIVGDSGGVNNYGEDKTYISLIDALNSVHNFSWLMVENFSIYTPKEFISHFPYSEFQNDDEFTNYFSNKSLYPQIRSGKREEYDREERLLSIMAGEIDHKYEFETPIIFTGSRFFNAYINPGYMYVSALKYLREAGLYEVKIDTENKLPTIGILNKSISGDTDEEVSTLSEDVVDESLFYEEFINTGTVLKTQGRVECLFEKEGSQQQFIEADKNEMFILPLDKTETARVSISTGKLGKVERKINGGEVGFIIDTRVEGYEDINPGWVTSFEERLRSF